MTLVINFSGGKDSSAMLAYICENWPDLRKEVVFADTGWEHTDAEDWSRSIVSRFKLPFHVVRNPNKDFFSMVRSRGMFPGPKYRQCTSDLKRGPIQTWIRQNIADKVVVNCMGLRAEESPIEPKNCGFPRQWNDKFAPNCLELATNPALDNAPGQRLLGGKGDPTAPGLQLP